jgi:hypothetical protein
MFSTFTEWVDSLLKAAGHKYIKRVPYMSGGKMRYRYIYKVTHMAGGKHVLDPEHMVQGAAFMLSSAKGSEVHAHITKVDGDMVTYRLDDGPRKGEMVTESKSKLAERLNAEHGVHEALAGAREKQAKVVADLKERGASEKQVAREQARLDRLSAATPAPEAKSEEPKKRAAKKPKSEELEPAPDYYADDGHDMFAAYTAKYGDAIADYPPRKEDMELVEGGARVETEKRTVDVNMGKGPQQMELVTFPQLSTEHMVLGLVPNNKGDGFYNLSFTVLTGPQKGVGAQVMELYPESVAPSTRAKQIVHGMMQMGMADALAQFDPSKRDTYPALQKVLQAVKARGAIQHAGTGLLPSASKVARAREFARAFARGDAEAIAPTPKPPKPLGVREQAAKESYERLMSDTPPSLGEFNEKQLSSISDYANKRRAQLKAASEYAEYKKIQDVLIPSIYRELEARIQRPLS